MVIDVLGYAFYGVDLTNIALFLNRAVLGLFFVIAGANKFFVRGRKEELYVTLVRGGIPLPFFCSSLVPISEVAFGVALIVGVFAPAAAMGIMTLMLVALEIEGRKTLKMMKPANKADVVDDVLYMQETLYICMSAVVILAGPGNILMVSL